MPESVNRRGLSGPTIGAMVGLCSGFVATTSEVYGRSIGLMEVTVRLFAMLRERAGADELTLELPEGARVKDALGELGSLAGGVPLVMAVEGDEERWVE